MPQETKRKLHAPKMNAKNLENYQVFELRWERAREDGGKGLNGGGLAVGPLHDLKPMLVRQEGDDDVECLTIEITAGQTKIRFVNGYGPQLGDTRERKEGLITRKMNSNKLNEKSVLDLFIVSNLAMPYVIKMHVDEQGEHQLSNFHCIKHNQKVTESDHAKVELLINIQFPQVKPTRTESYNLKSEESQKTFKFVTTNTIKLTICF